MRKNTDDNNWDAIVIGSGMGGMAVAAALSKFDHKVFLVEQYETLGGLTHSFSRTDFLGMQVFTILVALHQVIGSVKSWIGCHILPLNSLPWDPCTTTCT